MTENDDQRKSRPIDGHAGGTAPIDLESHRRRDEPALITFSRRELDIILRLYGRMVADGEWRDYAIDHLRERAVFSVFRRTSEVPLYRFEKNPSRARRQGAYAIVANTGGVLKRGHDLAQVLRHFDKPRRVI